MDRWKTEDPCVNVNDLARSMPNGIWLNLLVSSLDEAVSFQTEVLGCEIIYRDKAFAIMRFAATSWMVHSDTTYVQHPMYTRAQATESRGNGCQIRLQGCDPDKAQGLVEALGLPVLAGANDRPHGLREAFLCDLDGYVWVPSVLRADVRITKASS